ncbi:hypothetical protein SEVIR_9G103300v4 [Setaria viridis]|uniref:Uncharacterized protein n=2 Tax=Setaria TaxID=4554 RepID=A0A368SF36_SETIT|nr:hypothetical protein SETIT_9G105400v2 [Setaria italica]TKV91542.1 hypothetical protein SEVIR_9G103300v2 [Setaria viridis]
MRRASHQPPPLTLRRGEKVTNWRKMLGMQVPWPPVGNNHHSDWGQGASEMGSLSHAPLAAQMWQQIVRIDQRTLLQPRPHTLSLRWCAMSPLPSPTTPLPYQSPP